MHGNIENATGESKCNEQPEVSLKLSSTTNFFSRNFILSRLRF